MYRPVDSRFRQACDDMEARPTEVASVARVPASWVKCSYYQGTTPSLDTARQAIVAALRRINKRRIEDGRPHVNPRNLTEAWLFKTKRSSGRKASKVA